MASVLVELHPADAPVEVPPTFAVLGIRDMATHNGSTCDFWISVLILNNAAQCLKHLADVYSEQLRISLKSQITQPLFWFQNKG